MTPKAFHELALSLPDAHEEPHFARTSFRVGKKIFATMVPDGSEAMVRVAPADRLNTLLSTKPDLFFGYGGWTIRNGALGVRLPRVSEAVMKELVIDSWMGIASKRALTAFTETRKRPKTR